MKGRRSKQLGPRAYLICDVDVHVLTEGIALGEPCGTVLDQVEGLERPKRCQQFFYLQQAKNQSIRAQLGRVRKEMGGGEGCYLVIIQVVG